MRKTLGMSITLEHRDKTGQERYTFRIISPDSSAHRGIIDFCINNRAVDETLASVSLVSLFLFPSPDSYDSITRIIMTGDEHASESSLELHISVLPKTTRELLQE